MDEWLPNGRLPAYVTRRVNRELLLQVEYCVAENRILRRMRQFGCGSQTRNGRDAKFCDAFRTILRDGGVEPLRLPPRSPNLNAFAERWVRSVKEECLSRLILFGEASLRRALNEYVEHFHSERNHQGKGNILLFPRPGDTRKVGHVECSQRLGGLLRYYGRAA